MKKMINRTWITLVLTVFTSVAFAYSLHLVDELNMKSLQSELSAVTATPEEKKLIPLGDTFGIKLYTDGIIVSSLQKINSDGKNICPAEEAGIKTGDFIISVEGIKVENNEHFTQLLTENLSNEITLEVKRNDEVFEVKIKPCFDGEYYRLGMWIRDSAAGIGTLTFYDPETKMFAGLGHGICDVDTGELMTLKGGEPASVAISSIEKGKQGSPGKICGYFDSNEDFGDLIANTETGLYGTFLKEPTGKAFPIAETKEIKVGDAQIMCTLETGVVKTYDVSINDINNSNSTTKNMIVEMTDKELLEITGGIVQGMSGSPIIQNGKIIGAVTHVFVNDPTKGYGIFIENMLDTAENIN